MSSSATTTLRKEQILEAAQGKPLEDEERNIVEIASVRHEVEALNTLLNTREREGQGRTLPDPAWLSQHAPLLQQRYDLLIPMLIKDSNAIEMARKMLTLFEARQTGKITGCHQDLQFGRLAAKMHFPEHTHSEIDTRADQDIAKTMDSSGIKQKMFYDGMSDFISSSEDDSVCSEDD